MAKDTGVLDILINTTHKHVWLRKYESLGLGWKGVITFLNQYLTTGTSYINTTHMNAWLRKYESLGLGWEKGLFPFSTLQTYYTTYMGICQPPIRYFFYLINN